MSHGLIVGPEAEQDIAHAFAWYEARQGGLGLRFLEELELVFERIRHRPLEAPVLYRGTRRILTREFPYGVFYLASGEEITVLAVAHHAQDPSVWKDRR
jgi:plasmid stabilization system protein ParE